MAELIDTLKTGFSYVIIVLTITLLIFLYYRKKWVTAQNKSLAKSLNFDYVDEIVELDSLGFSKLLFIRTEDGDVQFLMKRKFGNTQCFLFDYSFFYLKDAYANPHKRKTSTFNLRACTVVVFKISNRNIPNFTCHTRTQRKYNVNLSAMDGYSEVDFSTHPKFYELYSLEAENDVEVRKIFNTEVISLLVSFKDSMPWGINGSGEYIVFHCSRQFVGEKKSQFLLDSLSFLDAMKLRI